MATKLKLTRPELKRQRDRLARFQRFLPMLKLKQQQLQMTMREVAQRRRAMQAELDEATRAFRSYEAVMADRAGLPLRQWAEPAEVRTSRTNIAGVSLPVFGEVLFPEVTYSLFGTPAWVDRALEDLRDLSRRSAQLEVLDEEYHLLSRELTRIIQRVNLFEKVKIPESQNTIRVIRIKLGDEMTAGVGRAKIAKSKLAESVGSARAADDEDEDQGGSDDSDGEADNA
ncbi:MAG: V-type ATP synthase subunit D [Phycisphaerae bacterium]|nr:V-type ATP synthase subunit D [Phycisphaerae bacterium]